MLLFLPHLILGATLLLLIVGNLFQRGFRSSWLLATAGASLALASLIFLRLRLPYALNSSAWWAGEGLVSSISFNLDGISWQFALIVCSLILAFFLLEVRKAITEPWLNWAAGLALAISSLFALVSGDWLTIAFFWVLVDATTAILIFRLISKAEQRHSALETLRANIAASFLLMAANILAGSSGQTTSLLVLIAVALRLGIFTSLQVGNNLSELNWTQAGTLRLLPRASVLVLLARSGALSGQVLVAILILLFLSTLINTLRWWQIDNGIEYFERGFTSLAMLGSVTGQPGVALGFGLVAMTCSSLIYLAQNSGSFKWLVIVPAILIFTGLPFSQVINTGQTLSLSWTTVLFLPLHALLIAGLFRKPLVSSSSEPSGEPWMRTISLLGLFILPVVFLVFILVVPPALPLETEFIWWPAVAVLLISLTVFILGVRSHATIKLPTAWVNLSREFFSLSWMKTAGSWVMVALDWILRMVNRVLEGQAGILWALLLIALLLSVASQFTQGG